MKKLLLKRNMSKIFYLILGILISQLVKIYSLDIELFFELSLLTAIIVILFELKGKNNFNIIKYKDIVK